MPLTKPKVQAYIRWMIRRDMPEVLAIDAAGYNEPWLEEDFLRVLRQRNVIAMIAEHGTAVIGFMVYEVHGRRFEMLRFAVHPDWRRQGVGAKMVVKIASKMTKNRRQWIMADISERSLEAQLFARDMGFRAIGVRRDFDGTDTIYRFVLEIRDNGSGS